MILNDLLTLKAMGSIYLFVGIICLGGNVIVWVHRHIFPFYHYFFTPLNIIMIILGFILLHRANILKKQLLATWNECFDNKG